MQFFSFFVPKMPENRPATTPKQPLRYANCCIAISLA